MTLFSFATPKAAPKSVTLIQTEEPTPSSDTRPPAVEFEILQGSLTANNKFYLSFGDKPPFNFFQTYPIEAGSKLVEEIDLKADLAEDYFRPVVWGIVKVTSTTMEDVDVGAHYIGMVSMGEKVSFEKATVQANGDLLVDRPATSPDYNSFRKILPNDPLLSKEYSALALACSPGILTGFGLYKRLERNHFFGADEVIITSASSKVALALALYMKESGKRIIGYTSPSNKDFCVATGLYDEILGYQDVLKKTNKSTRYAMVDIAGNGKVYVKNKDAVVKLLVVGNASGTSDKESTFACFSVYATIKLVLTMMGAPSWLSSWMNPTQELFLILKDLSILSSMWGDKKLQDTLVEYSQTFCEAATKWIKVRSSDTEEDIKQAFVDIVEGKVAPTETIALNVANAVAHRKK